MVLDDVVHIGSSNLDIRSLYLNMELMLRVDERRVRPADARLFRRRAWIAACGSRRSFDKKRATLLNRLRWAISFFLVTSFDYGVTRRLNFGLTGD